MKITDVRILKVAGDSKAYQPLERSREAKAIDVYAELDTTDNLSKVALARPSKSISMEFLRIDTDCGIYGLYNICPYSSAGFITITTLRAFRIGHEIQRYFMIA